MSANEGSRTRSPSPSASESPSDDTNNSEVIDFSAWCNFSPELASELELTPWNTDEKEDDPKVEEEGLRLLEELLKAQAQDPIFPESESPIAVNPAVFHLSQPQPEVKTQSDLALPTPLSNSSSDNSSCESATASDLIPQTTSTAAVPTKIIPPPPVQPRKADNTMHHRVIFPAKDTCYNLAILTPNIPAAGAKSRVETQVRVALDLALPSGSSVDPRSYDRVGSWKWLKLPKGTATRKRSRKEGKIDASLEDTLFLDTDVTCVSNPSKHVFSCQTCQNREAKRVARKIAARVRPTRSDSESNEADNDSSSKIVQFNCPDTLDFSSGSVVLPLRITCYCRHHREKVGFNVHFTMKDASGRTVGKGMSPPIMITDDHKSTDKATKQHHITSYLPEPDWSPGVPVVSPCESVAASAGGPSRRRQSAAKEGSTLLRRRHKPYDHRRALVNRSPRNPIEANGHASRAIANSIPASMDADATMMTSFGPFSPSVFTSTMQSPGHQRRESITTLPSPSNSSNSPVTPQSGFMDSSDSFIQDVLRQPYGFFPLSPPETAPSSPPSQCGTSSSVDMSFTYNMLRPSPEPPLSAVPIPKIHRLIPSSGPKFGGIEVTVLGSNFHPSILYNCVFGDAVSSSTTRWSENTLVCILPPRATAGVVPVTLEGLKMDLGGAPALFTYVDETDRTLMELALQVVGLKMTGKIEDAKDIAMRIVGSSQDSQGGTSNASQMMNLASSALPDSRRFFLGRGDDDEFERRVIDSLTSLDMRAESGEPERLTSVISHPTKTGQTLLHLAASLNLPSLVEFLIQRDISLNAQDINGFTALHAAVLDGSQCCARQIINAGANMNICTKMGYTAVEMAPEGFFETLRMSTGIHSEGSGDEAHFGDVEEDSGSESHPPSRAHLRRRGRVPRSRRPSRPASAVVSDASDTEDRSEVRSTGEDDDNATVVSPEAPLMSDSPDKDVTLDEKQAASFAVYLQRAWAQLHPPHLKAQMPQLPGMPAWVFPVFVPIQAWPPFRKKRHTKKNDEKRVANDDELHSSRTSWATEEESEQYGKPRSAIGNKTGVAADVADPQIAFTPSASRSILHRLGYRQEQKQIPEKEAQVYSHRKSKVTVKIAKKEDHMLIIFWIPILIVALCWALYASYPFISMIVEQIPWGHLTNKFKAITVSP